MEPLNFVYWLQGFMEIQNPEQINAAQIEQIKNHIALVLEKRTSIQTSSSTTFPLVWAHNASC